MYKKPDLSDAEFRAFWNSPESAMFNAIDPFDFDDHSDTAAAYYLLNGIDKRHRNAFSYYETGSPFEYELIRLLYGKARQLEISK